MIELVSKASCEGLHSFGRILFFSEVLENKICDPASAGMFEGRQIWEVRVEQTCLEGFMRSLTWFDRIFVFG